MDRRLRYRRLDLDLLYASVTGCMAARAQSSTGGIGGRKEAQRAEESSDLGLNGEYR